MNEFPHHVGERDRKRDATADQHVIVAGAQSAGSGGRRHPHDLAQSTAHAVAFRGVADLARHGEADTGGALIATRASLQHEAPPRGPRTAGGGAKIAPAFEPLDDHETGVAIRH
jgi:hypothetical protein